MAAASPTCGPARRRRAVARSAAPRTHGGGGRWWRRGRRDVHPGRTWDGWLYLAVIMDAFSRRVVGWALADHLRTELATDALAMALATRKPAPGLIHHS